MYNLLYSLANPIGMVGVLLILIAYFLLSTGRWIADSFKFQILNFLGAWLILYSLYFHWNLASVLIEIAWIIISGIGLYRAEKLKDSSGCLKSKNVEKNLNK